MAEESVPFVIQGGQYRAGGGVQAVEGGLLVAGSVDVGQRMVEVLAGVAVEVSAGFGGWPGPDGPGTPARSVPPTGHASTATGCGRPRRG